jgi:hypothetical protein
MTPTIKSAGIGRLVWLAVALALALSTMGCATGPLSSHGADYIPAFDTPDMVGGGGNG